MNFKQIQKNVDHIYLPLYFLKQFLNDGYMIFNESISDYTTMLDINLDENVHVYFDHRLPI